MALPKRKQIRLKEYEYSGNGAYFVTVCTHNRLHLFGDIVGTQAQVGAHLCVRPNSPNKIISKWLFELENKYDDIHIDKYAIMPNHIHFILFNSGAHVALNVLAPLPEMIKWFKTQTTNEYMKGVKRGLFPNFEKHIWQRNYYEHIIRNAEEYREIWQYIDQNPLNWEQGELFNSVIEE